MLLRRRRSGLDRSLGFEPFILRIGGDFFFDFVKVFDCRYGLVAAVLRQVAMGAGESAVLASQVLVEGLWMIAGEAIVKGVKLVGGGVRAVYVVELGAMFGDGEMDFGGMR